MKFLTKFISFIYLNDSIECKIIFIHRINQNLHFIRSQKSLILLTNSFIIVFEIKVRHK